MPKNNNEHIQNGIELNVMDNNTNHRENGCQFLLSIIRKLIRWLLRIFNICDENQKPGGLYNSKSTCYMNAMIQALSSSDVLINALEDPKECHSKSLLCDLLKALNEENINNETVMRNTNLLEDLIKSVGWTKPSQQDAFELLSALISGIYENSKDKDKILMPLKLEMMHTFSGINISSRTQFHIGLSIGLCGEYNKYPGVTLNYLVEQYFAPTIIDDDPNKTSNQLFLREPPNLLLLHIQANKWSSEKGEMMKPEYHIQYEKDLKFDAKCYIDGKSEPESVSAQYKLTAIVHHMGTISGGHYITYRTWKGQWYLTNDEQVSLVDFNCNVCPYILLYEKS